MMFSLFEPFSLRHRKFAVNFRSTTCTVQCKNDSLTQTISEIMQIVERREREKRERDALHNSPPGKVQKWHHE